VNPLAIIGLLLNSKFSSFKLFGRGQGTVGYPAPLWRESTPWRTPPKRITRWKRAPLLEKLSSSIRASR